MERNHFWIFIGMGLACGLCLEMIKAPSAQPVRLAGFTKFEAILEEGRPVVIDEEIPANVGKSQPAEDQQVAAANPGADSVVDAPPAQSEEEKAAALKKAEDEKKKAEEKKKADEKKKKKKKKKKEQTTEAQPQQPASDESEEKKKGFGDDGFGAPAAGAAEVGAGIAGFNAERMPQTIQEWEAYLMKDVDYERLSTFIKAHQSGLVKDEVFYAVIDAMFDDSRPKVRQMGITALGANPSQRSFQMLVDVMNHDSSKEVKSQADATLKTYARVENLRILVTVISGTDAAQTIEALTLLRLSAQAHLRVAQTQPQTQTTGQIDARTSAAVKSTKYFRPFVPALSTIARTSSDAGVRSIANQTLSELESMLAALPVPVTPAPKSPTT